MLTQNLFDYPMVLNCGMAGIEALMAQGETLKSYLDTIPDSGRKILSVPLSEEQSLLSRDEEFVEVIPLKDAVGDLFARERNEVHLLALSVEDPYPA